MRVGFTGTREGLTEQQKEAVMQFLKAEFYNEFHQGCCVGADEQATLIYQELYWPEGWIVGYPSTLLSLTSKKAWDACCDVQFPEDALARNRKIVDAAELLLACPKGPQELRSGTWYTVQFARKQHKPVVVFWPDGTVTEEKNK